MQLSSPLHVRDCRYISLLILTEFKYDFLYFYLKSCNFLNISTWHRSKITAEWNINAENILEKRIKAEKNDDENIQHFTQNNHSLHNLVTKNSIFLCHENIVFLAFFRKNWIINLLYLPYTYLFTLICYIWYMFRNHSVHWGIIPLFLAKPPPKSTNCPRPPL